MTAEQQKAKALEYFERADEYLREILPHDAPSSARKLEILGLFRKIRQCLAPVSDEGSKLSFADELKLLDAGCDKVIDIMNNRAALSTPSMEDELAEALEKIQKISAHMKSDRSFDINKIASEPLAKYRESKK